MLELLEQVASGQTTLETAREQVEQATYADLGFAKVDHQRAARVGFPEVIFAQGKTPAQISAIATQLLTTNPRLLITRLSDEAFREVQAIMGDQLRDAHRNQTAKTLTFGLDQVTPKGNVLVLCAGTSDLYVAEEALETARIMGAETELLADVGVAGIHRLLDNQHKMAKARALVVVAGMEGALPSVVGGLVAVPVIAVPTSVGYGTSFQGITPLLAMLNACAPGITVVNIDNGFGAGYTAALINNPPSPAE